MSRAANPNKAKKTSEELEVDSVAKKQKAEKERIRKLIITLGDENKKVVSQIRGLAAALEDDIELHGALIQRSVLDCAKCLPVKSGIYAAWLSKMADKHPQWATGVVLGALDDLRAAIQGGRTTNAQLLLRFLVSLASTGVVGVDAVLGLLQEVMGLSHGLPPNKGGDFGCFMALAQLPFLSASAYQQGKDTVAGLVADASKYIQSRDPRWKPLLEMMIGSGLPDRLEEIQKAVQSLSDTGWSSQVVLHVPGCQPASDRVVGVPDLKLGIGQDDFRKSRVRLQVPLVAARLLTSRMDAAAPLSATDRWVLEDYVLLTLDMFSCDIEECSKQLLRIPVLHPHFEAAVVEVLFCQMLQLPVPRLPPLFYSRLLEVCAEKQASMNKLIDEAFQALFSKLPDLDEDCLDALAGTFACRLSKNSFQADWSLFVGTEATCEAKRFAKMTFQKLQRLLEHHNMMHRLPEALHVLAPSEPKPASGLGVVSKPQFGRMINLVRLKDANPAKVFDFCQWLMKSTPKAEDFDQVAPAEEGDLPHPKRQKTEVKPEVHEDFGDPPAQSWPLEEVAELVLAVMLQQGHKTPTHMAKILDGHAEVLKQLRPADESGSQSFGKALARCVFEFWRAHGQRLEITIDALLNRKVLAPRQVVEVALMSKDCDELYVWNVLHAAARKCLGRLQSARTELAIAKKLVEEGALEKRRTELDEAIQETADLFLSIFTGLVRNVEEARESRSDESNGSMCEIRLRRITAIGRRYLADIKPLVDAAGSKIPGVSCSPDIAKVFAMLSTL
ncbi:ncbp1 [Symbiodinium natans]|uniref:Ncbp1 protein n=1 Tax=Symbiodinium natans TaxID=878477 RepID=A0A812SSY8_9DINO|nr:ncbp1 [Symbiodinium natans]